MAEHTQDKQVLTRVNLWAMTIATGLVVENVYYNQPLLGDIAKDFGVSEAKAGLPVLAKISVARIGGYRIVRIDCSVSTSPVI